MSSHSGGAVLFDSDMDLLANFYQQVAEFQRIDGDEDHIVLQSGAFRLIVHRIPEYRAQERSSIAPWVRRETPIKLCFVVKSIAQARKAAASLGGALEGTDQEWEYRSERVCDGHDPEGNVFQLIEPL